MKKRKKILIITNLFPTDWDKHRGMFNYQQFVKLSELHDLHIMIPVPFFIYNKHVAQQSVSINQRIEVRYVKFYYLPKVFRFLHGVSLWCSLLKERARIKKAGYDLVLGSWAFPDGYAAIKLAQSMRVPCLIKVHGSDINEFTKTRLRRYLICSVLKSADAIISVSNHLKTRMKSLGVDDQKIQVIYNGLNQTIFHSQQKSVARSQLNISEQAYVFLFVGNLKASKGIVELFTAYRRFIKDHDAQMYIIGDGEKRQWLEDGVEACHLSGQVFLTGRKDLNEISYYMSAANILVLPSYNEGVPNVLLEAKGCGLPVVATSVGGIPEICNTNDSVLVEKKNIDSLLNGMLEAYNKEWDHSVIIRQSQQYSWEKNCDLLDRVISNVS